MIQKLIWTGAALVLVQFITGVFIDMILDAVLLGVLVLMSKWKSAS